jgi:hypothetical protein
MSSDPKNSLGRRPSPALVVALLALFVALSGTAYATTDGKLALGQANTAAAPTSLTAPVAGPALQLRNTSSGAGAAGLDLNVASGHPPLTVNSDTRVANLNADKLDGIDASGFYAAGSKVADSQHSDTAGALSCTGCVTDSQLSPGLMKRVHWIGSFGDTGSFTIGAMELRVECTTDAIVLGTIDRDPNGKSAIANVTYNSYFGSFTSPYGQFAGADGYTTAIREGAFGALGSTWGGGTWMFQLPTETDSAQLLFRYAYASGFEDPNDHSRFNCGFDAILTHLS